MDDIHLEKKTNENFKDFDNLYRNGLLSIELLKALWDHSDFYLHQNNLVKHMKHLDMLAELEPGLWYVPCINKQKYTETVLKNCTISYTLCFVFDFLPIDVYHRLINACINKLKMTLWKRNEYCIYHSVTMLKCKNTKHRLVIGIRYEERDDEYPYSIEIQAIETHPRNPESQWCSEIKENIYRILSDLTFISRGVSFEVGYLCSKLPHTNRPQGHIILEKELEKGVDCFKCSSVHAGDGELILGFWERKNDSASSPSVPHSVENEQAIIDKDTSAPYSQLTENKQSSDTSNRNATDPGFDQRATSPKSKDSQRSNAYGMQQIHKDALRRTRVALVETLDVDIIYDELLGKDIFTPLMMEYIKNERTRIDKVRRLLDDLIRRGSNAYHDFLEVIGETGYKHLAKKIVENEDILRKENASKQAKAEIHTSFNLIFDKTKSNTPVLSPLVPSGISNSNSNPTSLEPFGPSSTSKLSSEFVPPPTRAESSNVEPHPGGLVVHEIESDN